MLQDTRAIRPNAQAQYGCHASTGVYEYSEESRSFVIPELETYLLSSTRSFDQGLGRPWVMMNVACPALLGSSELLVWLRICEVDHSAKALIRLRGGS